MNITHVVLQCCGKLDIVKIPWKKTPKLFALLFGTMREINQFRAWHLWPQCSLKHNKVILIRALWMQDVVAISPVCTQTHTWVHSVHVCGLAHILWVRKTTNVTPAKTMRLKNDRHDWEAPKRAFTEVYVSVRLINNKKAVPSLLNSYWMVFYILSIFTYCY